MKVPRTIAARLGELGRAPQDVEYVAFSHLRGDHSGNAGLFTNAIRIVSQEELTWTATCHSQEDIAALPKFPAQLD